MLGAVRHDAFPLNRLGDIKQHPRMASKAPTVSPLPGLAREHGGRGIGRKVALAHHLAALVDMSVRRVRHAERTRHGHSLQVRAAARSLSGSPASSGVQTSARARSIKLCDDVLRDSWPTRPLQHCTALFNRLSPVLVLQVTCRAGSVGRLCRQGETTLLQAQALHEFCL